MKLRDLKIRESVKKELIDLAGESEYDAALEFNTEYISSRVYESFSGRIELRGRVYDDHTYYYAGVDIFDDKIHAGCNCMDEDDAPCRHIVALILANQDDVFPDNSVEGLKEKTNNLLDELDKINNKKRSVKEEVFVEYHIVINYHTAFLQLKVGKSKMYLASSKIRAFLNAIKDESCYKFGKSFEYDPDTCFFNKDNEKMLNMLIKYAHTSSYDGIPLNAIIDEFVHLSTFDNVYINNNKIDGVIDSSTIEYNLTKKEDNYILNYKETNYDKINQNYYIKDRKLYRCSKKHEEFYDMLKERKIKSIVFDKDKMNSFVKNILPNIKENLNIDKSVDVKLPSNNIKEKYYFDIKGDKINAKVIFDYDGIEVNYFDKDNVNVLRDLDKEYNAASVLYKYNFNITNKNIYLDNIDDIGAFMEYGLIDLSNEYEVYTTENFKRININKNNKVKSSFTIGKDNILSYNFNISNIDEKEISGILKSIKDKKKYYKLNNGDLINLDNEELNELNDLTDELNLSYKDIKESGALPKYYSLYLSSLKDKKYDIITTDNLFDDFIDKFNTYKSVKVSFEEDEINTLRDYQIDGVKWLYTLYKCGFGGILADEMGLGKSIQTISFIRKVLDEMKDAKILIVVPTSLIYNWENEFNKFGKDISICLVNGNKVNRESLLKAFDKSVYITTYGLLREDEDLYKDKSFECTIIDEAQNIKNPSTGITKASKMIKTSSAFALTGTPIENSLTEIWSIYDYLMPGFLGSLTNFNSKYNIKEFDDKSNKLIKALHEHIKPFILRRKKKDVIKDLPDKIENNIFIDLSKEEMALYASEVKRVQDLMEELVKTNGFKKSQFEILKLLTRLRQICIDPSIVFDNVSGISSKIENLIKVLNEVILNGHKVLLFSSFRTALDIVKDNLDKNNITYYTIDGSVSSKKRMELVDKFNKDDTNVFLIMLKSGGTGLNLTSADVVIHLDLWWNPQSENQATDRTHRIGQDKVVEVIKLITKGTIEEKILSLQEKKKILSDKLIESDNPDYEIFSKLSEDDIKNLLAYENSSN